MLESPQLSADMRALILKPNVTPRTFAEKAFKTVMTDLFLRSFHVSERGAGRLWSAKVEGNNYYEEDASSDVESLTLFHLISVEQNLIV